MYIHHTYVQTRFIVYMMFASACTPEDQAPLSEASVEEYFFTLSRMIQCSWVHMISYDFWTFRSRILSRVKQSGSRPCFGSKSLEGSASRQAARLVAGDTGLTVATLAGKGAAQAFKEHLYNFKDLILTLFVLILGFRLHGEVVIGDPFAF